MSLGRSILQERYHEGEVKGYLEELGQDSNVETYAAVKFFIDNDRWRDVPIYLRTAKGYTKMQLIFQ